MSITVQSKARRPGSPKKPGTRSKKKTSFSFARRSVKQKELFFFLTQLSLMLDVGISLSKAIESIKVQTLNEYFKKIMEAMVKDIEEGHQLSTAKPVADLPRPVLPCHSLVPYPVCFV